MADEYYFICDTCGAFHKNEKYYINPKEEKERYEEHHNDVNNSSYQRFTSPITNAILANHTKTQLGLDYGCGTGPVISKQLSEKEYQVHLYDPFFYPNLDYMNYKYDYIFSCEVFEHFHQPKIEIENLLALLKSGGKLYVMTHLYNSKINFNNWYYRNDKTHVFIFTLKTIEYIIKTYNLISINISDRLFILQKRANAHM